MSIVEDFAARAPKELLTEIHNRATLPRDSQCDFAWEPSPTWNRIVSIANNMANLETDGEGTA